MNIKIISALLLSATFHCTYLVAAPASDQSTLMPSNPQEMKPLPDGDSPARHTAQWFKRGANLGDYLEVQPSYFGHRITVGAGEFAQMKNQGFDHVRVPIAWQDYTGPAPDFKLAPVIFERVDFVVTNALKNGLAVMINIHHFDALDKDPAGASDEFLKIWEQIASHYKTFPDQLVFELDNEPHQNATTVLMNPLYARTIAEIRRTNLHRTIVVEPGEWGSIGELKNLVLSPDSNVIVSVHCYDPFYFTHQGATWTNGMTPVTGIIFPGPPSHPLMTDVDLSQRPALLDWIKKYNTLPTATNPSSQIAFKSKLKFLRAWSDYYRYPIHIGEFGAYTRADEQSRVNFYSAFRRAAEAEKLGWAIWDWSSGFRYWDKMNNRPMPGMRQALFGN
ncbi:MAG TPA: glycoside hydrolase family 5 protein [Tepidisphaeraceae bacterium]|jgi:endoglucanase